MVGVQRALSLAVAGVERLVSNRRSVDPVVYTVGYEDHREPRELVAVLETAGVELLVDVRDLPLSRRRGFSKTALSDVLAAAGIKYTHDRALGNPKPLRDLYRSGRKAEGERRYRTHVRNGSAAAVDELSRTLDEKATCLLCFEANHRDCHRAIVVEELQLRRPRLRVEHL